MADDSKTYFLGLMCIYLIIASALISYAIVNIENEDGGKELGIFNSIPSLKNADFRNPTYQNISHIDYTDSWEFSETKGLYSTSESDNKLYFQGINTRDGYYQTTYSIQNPNENYIEIIYRDTSLLSRSYVSMYDNRVELWDKAGVISGSNLLYPVASYPVTYNQSAFTVSTYYNYEDGIARFYLDNKMIFERVISTTSTTGAYAGLFTDGADTCILSMNSNIEVVKASEEAWGFFEFLTVMVSLIAYTVDDEYLPWWLNAVFIKVPILLLIYIIVCLARGS